MIIAIHGSHDASISFLDKCGKIRIFEVERFSKIRSCALSNVFKNTFDTIDEYSYVNLIKLIKNESGNNSFEMCYYNQLFDHDFSIIQDILGVKKFIKTNHHRGHARCAYHQSNFKDSLIFSFDGGGNDGKFNIYQGTRENSVQLLETILNPVLDNPHIHYDLGFPYMIFGHYLKDIKQEPLNIGNLVYPGKIMGLASYGKVQEKWLPYFIEFYKSNPDGTHFGDWGPDGYWDYEPKLKILGDQIGVTFDSINRFEGELAYDIATTSQRAFEDCFLEIAEPYFDLFPDAIS